MASKSVAAIRTSTRTRGASVVQAPTTTTRTTRARTKAAATTVAEAEPVKKKTNQRKPLVSKDNAVDTTAPTAKPKLKATGRKTTKPTKESEPEPIMAYLRIRPHLGEEGPMASPYLSPLSDTTVNMTNPHDPQDGRPKYRFSTVPPSSVYTFSHVFPSNTTQCDFFTKTTLPLVQDVLQGQNALLFTYGVTNSGKTYTVQGGREKGTAGILPRSLDVIFNSIEGLHGNGKYRPTRLQGIELADGTDLPPPMPEPALAQVLGSLDNIAEPDFDVDSISIKVDRNYEYTVWISYTEVYNEKVYDLLASVKDEPGIHADGRQHGQKSLLLTRQALPLRPAPPSDTMDTECTGKYIAGLRQFRVRSAAEAKSLVKLGQLHRRVFGTLANRESSRSHGMVILKIVRGHKGERDDPTSLQVSRLTLVDLAGSERTKHTQTTGDRLKEAGNINKSLMVLGQCLEVMRSNQRKIAMSLAQDSEDGRIDTRDIKQGLAIVPFRHSKLTEALMDYFVGDGRTIIIVNINPYDTGYDENSHVMKFAALAREVQITPTPAPVQRVPVVGPGKAQGNKIRRLGPLTLRDPDIVPHPYSRKVHISMGGDAKGKNTTEAILEVVEEDEPQDEADKENEDDHPTNPLVDALFDEVESLRLQLYEAEMRCALIEAETREEVLREMEERMRKMEAMYSRRLMSEWEQNELKTDAKIDMLHQSGLFGSPVKMTRQPVDSVSEEDDVEMSLVDYGEPGDDMSIDGSFLSLSPLAHKIKSPMSRKKSTGPQIVVEKRLFIPDPSPLPSDTDEAQETEADDDDSSVAPSGMTESVCSEDGMTGSDGESETESDDDDEGWKYGSKTPKAGRDINPSPRPSPKQKARTIALAVTPKTPRVSKLAQDMDDLCIHDSAVILPRRLKGTSTAVTKDEEEDSDVVIKKKKRQLGKRSIATEDDINKLAYAAEKKVAKTRTIKRVGK